MVISDGWCVLLLSMLPITELRVAIPLGIAWGMPPFACFLWAIIGNFLPVIPLLFLFYRFGDRMQKHSRLFRHWFQSNYLKGHLVQKYGGLGLTLLVAIPLPFTGVWTGCLVAVLFAVPWHRAIAAIALGEVIAGALVSLAASGVIFVADATDSAHLALWGMLLLLVFVCIRHVRRKRKR